MSKINLYDIDKLRNINEIRVWDLIAEFLEQHPQLCNCRDCVMDMLAITLNTIPPHYQANEDDLVEAIKKVPDDEILMQMSIAAERVSKHPHH